MKRITFPFSLFVVMLSLAGVLLSCGGSEYTLTRVEIGPSGDTLAVFEVLKSDSLIRNGKTKLYYRGGKQMKSELTFVNGRLMSIDNEFDANGTKRSPSPEFKNGTGTYIVYDETGMAVSRIPYASGFPSGVAELLLGGQIASQMMWQNGLPAGFQSAQSASMNGMALAQGDSISTNNLTTAPVEGVDQAALNAVVQMIASGQIDVFYQNSFSKLKAAQSLNDTKKYFGFCESIYGKLTSWKLEGYNLQSQAGMGQGLEVVYNCQFKYTPGQVSMMMIKENGVFKPAMTSIQVPPYTPITKITQIADPIVKMMKEGRSQELYDIVSDRMKQKTPLSSFEQIFDAIKKEGGISSASLLQHEVGLLEHKLALIIVYELKIGGKTAYMEMTFTEKNSGGFILEGLNIQ